MTTATAERRKQITGRLAEISARQDAIEAAADAAAGVMSDEQLTEFANLEREARALAAEQKTLAPKTSGRLLEPDSGEPLRPEDMRGDEPGRAQWVDSKTGEDVLVLEPHERFRPYAPAAGRPSLGRLILAKKRGKLGIAATEMAAMGTNDAYGSDVLVEEQLADYVIDKARAASVLIRAGARTVAMTAQTMRIARIVTDPTFAVVAENAPIGETNIVLDDILLEATKIAAIIRWSRELQEDAPNVPDLIEGTLARSLAVELDRLAINGPSTGTFPNGLLFMADLPETAIGGAIDWDDLIGALETIRTANYEPNAVLMHPAVAADLARLKDSAGNYLAMPPAVDGLLRLTSTSVPAGSVIVGDFTRMLLAIRREVEVSFSEHAVVNGESVWQRDQRAIRTTWRGAFEVEDVNAFVKLTGIT